MRDVDLYLNGVESDLRASTRRSATSSWHASTRRTSDFRDRPPSLYAIGHAAIGLVAKAVLSGQRAAPRYGELYLSSRRP